MLADGQYQADWRDASFLSRPDTYSIKARHILVASHRYDVGTGMVALAAACDPTRIALLGDPADATEVLPNGRCRRPGCRQLLAAAERVARSTAVIAARWTAPRPRHTRHVGTDSAGGAGRDRPKSRSPAGWPTARAGRRRRAALITRRKVAFDHVRNHVLLRLMIYMINSASCRACDSRQIRACDLGFGLRRPLAECKRFLGRIGRNPRVTRRSRPQASSRRGGAGASGSPGRTRPVS
ncbi:hypothetical protein Pth03_82560 [Planotetraspora thailandica]|uniref:Uncharacterized protein n=1 Tax=Planotetraspora thailandica TaxID=487172 RepID=A0A8J4DGT4_9ACTN|nr:hypothetical protein Pth03_82560 [Planotetraspora thailandica]